MSMKINPKEVTVRELTNGYHCDKNTDQVVGFGGNLDIRPPYQREFIYKPKQRDAVIDTVFKGYPLNTMYWVDREDGKFEVLDGQQRTISICQYVKGDFSFKSKYFHNLTDDEQNKFLDYKLMVYTCAGPNSEKLDWFETINIAGEELSKQELRNATYSGPWVTDAKRYFSKNGCPAQKIGADYLNRKMLRQEYLEEAIKWISGSQNDDDIREYMAQHQFDADAQPLFSHFRNVIEWVQAKFPKYRKEMKNVPWGTLFAQFGQDRTLNAEELEKRVAELMADSMVEKKSGIYQYVLDGDERHLDLNREFDENVKREIYEKQNGICIKCGKHFEIEQMHADHITPWAKGGRTVSTNCQILCADCNRRKSDT